MTLPPTAAPDQGEVALRGAGGAPSAALAYDAALLVAIEQERLELLPTAGPLADALTEQAAKGRQKMATKAWLRQARPCARHGCCLGVHACVQPGGWGVRWRGTFAFALAGMCGWSFAASEDLILSENVLAVEMVW
jgi:hypothetical protein